MRRVDARFLLPAFPETAIVMHSAWFEGLQQVGIRIVDPGEGAAPDLVVAPANLGDAARRVGAPMMLLDGRPRRRFSSVGATSSVRRYLPVQTRNGAIVVVDLSHGLVAERALAIATHAGSLRAAVKRGLARAVVRFGLLPPIVPMYTVHSDSSTTPALVREAARRAGVDAVGWFLLIEPGADYRRLVFFLFTDRGDAHAVVKFSRLANDARKARLEARGLEAARSAGPIVVTHAPKLLGEFEIGRHYVTVQTAITGQALGRTVSARGARRRKLMQIEAVVDWLCDIARVTAHRRGSLSDDIRKTITRSFSDSDADRLVDVACAAPAVFQHGDLSDGNIIADGDAFVAVDWELARSDGFPLWDYISLAVCTLPLLDGKLYDKGARRADEHVRHLGDIFRGRAPSSAVFLRWLRKVADTSGVDPAVVPEIVTLWFLWYSEQWAGWAPLERFTSEWLASPELGMSWPLWRDGISGF